MKKWYQKSYYRNLIDMHIADSKEGLLSLFDADTYADLLSYAGFDTAYVYASNCLGLCLYPTKVGIRHPEAKKRDLFGETVNACKARGIRPVGYLNFWSTACYDKHPEWRVVGRKGNGHRDFAGHAGRYGVLCPNSPYANYFLSLVREVCEGYPIEGLWLDMVGFWRGACFCESCKRKFREETGESIPERVAWTDPLWRRYIAFKTRSLRDFAARIRDTAKAARPNISVSLQSAGWALGAQLGFDEGYFEASDYAAGDFYTDVRDGAIDCKLLFAVSRDQPFEYMVSRCPTLTLHTVSKPFSALRAQAYASLLHGGAFLLIDAIDPEGTLDPSVYRMARELKAALSPYTAHPSFLRGEPLSSLGIYVNYASAFDPGQDGLSADEWGGPAPIFTRLKQIGRTLSRRHISYDILLRGQLSHLSRYPAILLSEVYTLTREECEAFRRYVKEGGRLYVSGRCGTIRPLTEAGEGKSLLSDDFALADVLGLSLADTLPYDTCYLRGTAEGAARFGISASHPLGTKAKRAPAVRAHRDTEVLARASLPVSNHSDGRCFISAISDPPWEETDIPVLTAHTYGEGICIYSALLLEEDKNEAPAELFLNLIASLLVNRAPLRIDAPSCVEISVKQTKEGLSATLLHTLFAETGAPAGETVLTLAKSLWDGEAVDIFPSGSFSLERAEDTVRVRLSSLPELAIVTFK